MTPRSRPRRCLDPVRRFLRAESGAGLVEYSLVILLFLVLLFAIIDFGRLGFAIVSANKANQIAARIAAVRPPACDGPWPSNIDRGTNTTVTYGTLCRAGTDICADPGLIICNGNSGNPTAAEIFGTVRALMPPQTGIEDFRFRYSFDPNLGFLGGPYIPMVTVELAEVQFDFVVPLWGNAANITLPNMSVSLPGENLGNGP